MKNTLKAVIFLVLTSSAQAHECTPASVKDWANEAVKKEHFEQCEYQPVLYRRDESTYTLGVSCENLIEPSGHVHLGNYFKSVQLKFAEDSCVDPSIVITQNP